MKAIAWGRAFRLANFNSSPARAGIPQAHGSGHRRLHLISRRCCKRRLSKKVTLTIGDKERILTKAAAGIEQLVEQFACGDRYARRDLFDLAEKLGLDLGASSKAALDELTGKALTADDEALVADFLKRHSTDKSNGDGNAQTSPDKMR
jgi:hypothetical protein